MKVSGREGGEEDECSVTKKKDSLGFVFPLISIHHSTTTPPKRNTLLPFFQLSFTS